MSNVTRQGAPHQGMFRTSADYPGFVHTVLVDMRARLRASVRPDRIFDVVLDVANAAGPGSLGRLNHAAEKSRA